MSEKNFQINKKDLVSRFKALVRKHADQEDEYNPKNAKQVGNHRDYFILDKIRAIYNWVIDEVKIELRRKYIHDDKSYKKAVGELENYARNKIRSEKDGTMYLRVNNQLTFRGDNKEYRDNFVQNRNKQLSVFRKIVDELNTFLSGKEEEDTNKPILNDMAPRMMRKEHTTQEIAEIILKEVPDDYLLEISEQKFDNFNNKLYVLLNKYNVTAVETKELINKIQESYTPQEENENESETDNTESETTEV